MNKFIESAVVAEITEVEERRRLKKEGDAEATAAPLRVERTADGPEGLGIGRAQQRRAAEPPAEPAPIERQVVVNVGAQSTTSTNIIDKLASYVAGAKDFDRDVRLRKVVDILRDTAATDEERKVLAAQLDEAVAAKTNEKENSGTGVVRAARIAFDKIADILK